MQRAQLTTYHKNLIVSQSVSDPTYIILSHEVLDRQHYMYSITLMQLSLEEMHMNAGRFSNFENEQQRHVVQTVYRAENQRYAYGQSIEGDFQNTIKDKVNWCASHAKGTDYLWSFRVDPQNVSTVTTTFSFSNLDLALLFKLSFT